MDEQDKMLISSLKANGFTIDDSINNLGQFSTDQLIGFILQFFSRMGLEQVKISSLRTLKESKFRQAAKIQEELQNEYGIRMEVQSILNPNLKETRKLIVSALSKYSSILEDEKTKNQITELTFEERVKKERQDRANQIVSNFINDQWINPTLINHETNNQRFLRLHVENIINEESMLNQVSNPGFKQFLYNSVSSRLRYIDANLGKKRGQTKYEGFTGIETLQQKLQLIKKLRKVDDADQFLNQFKGQFGEESQREGEDWAKLQEGGRLMQKAIKLMKEEDQQEEITRKEKEQENQNLFTLEIQFQKEIPELEKTVENEGQQINQIEIDLQNLRKKNREEIDQLQQALKEKEIILSKLINQRAQYDEDIQKKSDKIVHLKELNIQNQKQMENQHLILQQIEQKNSIQDMEQELLKLENENDNLQNEWFKQKLELENEVAELKSKTQERKDRIQQLKDKIKRLEDENQSVRIEGKNNLERKEALIQEFQKMSKEASRTQFIKRIQDLSQNLKRQQAELEKVKKEISQIEEQIDLQNSYINRYYIELENLFSNDPKKKEPVVTQITAKYQEYRQLYKEMIASIKDIAQKKIEVQEMEIKHDLIQVKGYKNNIEKLQTDLNQIKQENSKLRK